MNLKSLILLFFVLISAVSLKAQSSLLWEISRGDLSFKSYLFGTDHIVSSKLIDTSETINKAINDVQRIVTEADTEDLDTAELVSIMKMKPDEYYTFPSVEDEEFFKNFLKNYAPGTGGIYMSFKPMIWVTILQLILSVKDDSLRLKSLVTHEISAKKFETIDKYFTRKGNEQNKVLDYFETAEEQLSILLDSISIKQQCEILVSFMRNAQSVTSYLQQLDSCYRNIDTDCLSRLNAYGDKSGAVNKLFLDNRNLRWMQKIPGFINGKPTLIAVGLLHLTGENGLINLLKLQGYKVQPIKIF